MEVESDNNGGAARDPNSNNNNNNDNNDNNLSDDQQFAIRQYGAMRDGLQDRVVAYRITHAQLMAKPIAQIRQWAVNHCESALKLVDQEQRKRDKVKVLERAVKLQRKLDVKNLMEIRKSYINHGMPGGLLPELELNEDEVKECEIDEIESTQDFQDKDDDWKQELQGLKSVVEALKKDLDKKKSKKKKKRKNKNKDESSSDDEDDDDDEKEDDPDRAMAAKSVRDDILQAMKGSKAVTARKVCNFHVTYFFIYFLYIF